MVRPVQSQRSILRNGGAYKLENVFDGVSLQRAADKIKPYRGQDGILVQPQEVFLPEETEKSEEEDEEPRPVREQRPVRRYIEEDDNEEPRLARRVEDDIRPAREHRPVRRYIEDA